MVEHRLLHASDTSSRTSALSRHADFGHTNTTPFHDRASANTTKTTVPWGFWTVETLNLSFCAVPKAGSSMMHAVVASMVGALTEGQCFIGWSKRELELLRRHNVTRTYSPSVTNIAIVRDPWTRAVSSFADQINRRYVKLNHTKSDFIRYLRGWANRRSLHHTGSLTRMCTGLAGARFDHVIDLEDTASFARVARAVPNFGRFIDNGWEHCTQGEPRLYIPGSIAPHKNMDPQLHLRLCDVETLRVACEQYAEDFDILRRIGHPYECSCKASVTATLPRRQTASP